MNFSKYLIAKILFLAFAAQGMTQEKVVPAISPPVSEEQDSLSSKQTEFFETRTKKKVLYASLSFVPGAGVSVRERHGFRGTAIDCKVGGFPFVFDTVSIIPVVSVDYNILRFSKDRETSPYLSYGIGAANFIPYIPLRAGVEFQHGFVDMGAKIILGLIPSPEVRAGVSLPF